jgi:hypothetical protein
MPRILVVDDDIRSQFIHRDNPTLFGRRLTGPTPMRSGKYL